ncbi:MAG: hypothetical protein R8G66_13345 [Cytophagales bacterium]|nr:hypothetical protein [Cytophagales bacterium]
MDFELWIDILGWIGSVEVILAYALISNGKVHGKSVSYQLLNLTGSIFLTANTVYYRAYPSTAINLVWMVVAIVALIQAWTKKSD